ncbi:hypothetical protein G9A89_005606 [Geosiphon pyriformis]|nr:hypothetical protein G9A89_005606 [Geosiphon pyriformis]
MLSEILKIKNNSLEPANIVLIPNPDAFTDLEAGPEEFHEHYQHLAPTREEQEQCLTQINTRLCDHCLIPCDFQYYNKYDLIYNLPSCIIYIILEEKKPISSCTLELESTFNSDSNSNNNNDKNNSFSSAQCSNKKYSNLNSYSNSKTYIALSNFTKEQELKWFSNNNKGIMPEHIHNTDTEFDLRYPRKDPIKLKSHLCTCINLKIALEIPATTMGINIKKGIIDTGYVRNIIAILQNDSERAYIIDPNEKIAQAIFLPLGFGSTDRIDVSVNMAEEKIIDKGEIISTCQPIFILPYDQYIIVIEKKVKDQIQIFEAEATLCESGNIGLVNLHILAKNHSHIKIPIYNNTEDIIEILKEITIGYLITEIEDQFPNIIPDFL